MTFYLCDYSSDVDDVGGDDDDNIMHTWLGVHSNSEIWFPTNLKFSKGTTDHEQNTTIEENILTLHVL